jgi:hypothetical protein
MPVKGQQVATAARRKEFIEKLKAIGPGELCIYWPWSTVRDGYVFVRYDGRTTTAHRWVYEQVYGSLSSDLEACHSCDNPPCVRPSHLWAGTHGENLRDAYRKGRKKAVGFHAPPGEDHPMAKLSARDVQLIRALHDQEGVGQRSLARVFGVSHPQIHNIVRGKSWAK